MSFTKKDIKWNSYKEIYNRKFTQNSRVEVTITLKEITDLLEVRHDRALKQVDILCKEPSFGEVSKIDTLNPSNAKIK